MVTRHEFLSALHDLLRPRSYLEIGVQHGWSLQLAKPGCVAIGIDPDPRLLVDVGEAAVVQATSDDFFARVDRDVAAGAAHPFAVTGGTVDFGFIDGMHLYEQVVEDFANVERWSHPGTVIAIDDVLPRNQAEAARQQCPGDWTGDVWRIRDVLIEYRPDLQTALVDTQPTGILLVWGLKADDRRLVDAYSEITARWPLEDVPVAEDVLTRANAVAPDRALEAIQAWKGRS